MWIRLLLLLELFSILFIFSQSQEVEVDDDTPHFYGFNEEKIAIKKDYRATNQLFHIYCSYSISIITFLGASTGDALFMTKFWVRLGNTLFTLNTSTEPEIVTSNYEGPFFLKDKSKFAVEIEDGKLEWDKNLLTVYYKYLIIYFYPSVHSSGTSYMSVDIELFNTYETVEDKATGIIGRTLHKSLSSDEFENFLYFKATLSDAISFTCTSLNQF